MSTPPSVQSASSATSPSTVQVTHGPSMAPPGSVPPYYYQVPPIGFSHTNGVPPPSAQSTQVTQFPNGHYYPPQGFFFPQQTKEGQGAFPPGYPYAHGWHQLQHYQAPMPHPNGPPHVPGSVSAAPRNTPAAPEPAFGIDPALLADDNPLPVAPPISGGRESDQPPNVASSTTGVCEPTASPGEAPSASTSVETPAENTTSSPTPVASVSRATKRRRTDEDHGASEDSQEEDGEEDDKDDNKDDGTPSTTVNSKKAKRLAASKSKPIFQHVLGAGMGGEIRDSKDQSDAEKIYRTRELTDPFVLQAASTRHYRRNIPEIITRIENLASRCGCLAYFAIQHFESGENFYYYISEALLDWAPGDARDIHKKVGSTFSSVMAAYQAAKVELQHDLDSANTRATAAEQKATAMQEERDKLMEERALALEELERLKAVTAASATPVNS